MGAIYTPKHACCLNCAHKEYVDGIIIPRTEDELEVLRAPLPNAHEAGEIGQYLLVPDQHDNPSFLMTSVDGETRKFHGRFNRCTVYDENLDIPATQEIERLINSADYILHGGIIYAIMLDLTGIDYKLSDVGTPHDAVYTDYQLGLIGGDASTLYKRYAAITDIVQDKLAEQGKECIYFRSRMTGGKIHTTKEFGGRKLRVVL